MEKFIAYCFQILLDLLGEIWKYILRALQYLLQWILENIVYPICPDLGTVNNSLPSNVFDFSFIDGSIIALLNEFVPVGYVIGCVTAYCIIAAIVYLINWILGLIPTVS